MTDPQIQIRQATENDVDAIVRIVNAGGPTGKRRRPLPKSLPESYFAAFKIIDQDPHQKLMVAEKNQTVIGTFHLTFLTYLHAAGQPDLQIEAVHVVADCRGQGIGTTMLQWAIAEGRRLNCRRIQLTTDKQRYEAHSLYQRMGFVFSHEGAKLVF